MSDDLVAVAHRVGEDAAAPWADEVDRDSRFPAEAVGAARQAGLLGAMVPAPWGGPGADLAQLSAMVSAIAQNCGSSGLILAMHYIQVASIVRHASPATQDTLLPRVAAGELLLASANSEVGLGGNRRSSVCALEPVEGGFHLDKQASTVSYGEYSDAILATARSAPNAPAGDQVLAICLHPDLELKPSGEWDSLGMRGTCSRPGSLVADVPEEQVIRDYGNVFLRTSLPVSAVLLASVWLGIAEAAGSRAHAFVRAQARKSRREAANPAPPPSALRLAELAVPLHQMRRIVLGGAADYEAVKDLDDVEGLEFSSRMDNLKLAASTLVIDVAQRAMYICGLAGYQNGNPFSVGRMMRDAASAPLMINNDRSLLASAQTLLVRRQL